MTTNKLKSDLFRYIEEINDKNILTAMRSVLSNRRKTKKDFWDDLSDSERKEIIKAMRDIDKGHFYSLEEVLAKHKKK